MTTREWIDSLPETLLQDERILSARERELLANVLRQARSCNHDPGNKIAETMARAIGETVVQRAYLVLGERILQGLERQPAQASGVTRLGMGPLPVPSPPAPPSPQTPGPHPPSPDPPASPNNIFVRRDVNHVAPFMGPHPPGMAESFVGPRPLSASSSSDASASFIGPRPPSQVETWVSGASTQGNSVGTMEDEDILPANCVIFEEFLVPSDLEILTRYTLEHETDFHISQVISPGVKEGRVDHEHRRSRVLSEPREMIQRFLDRVKASLPRVVPKLGGPAFVVAGEEAQITASNHGDFFRWHSDNGQQEIASREITFVYFFHREPKRFEGGELRIHDSQRREGAYFPTGNYRTIIPRQNQIVFFRSSLAHEITPVECPSGEFGDSRFTVNGWFHR